MLTAPSAKRQSALKLLANKQRICYGFGVAVRTCRVTCVDLNGIEHSVDVTADTLYEAVARGLVAFREAEWAGDIGQGETTVTVMLKQPEVEHKVRMRDFEAWLDSNARSPAEMTLKSRLRELLGR